MTDVEVRLQSLVFEFMNDKEGYTSFLRKYAINTPHFNNIDNLSIFSDCMVYVIEFYIAITIVKIVQVHTNVAPSLKRKRAVVVHALVENG